MRFIQLLASLNPSDAVSDFARELAGAADGLGIHTSLVAGAVHPACTGEARFANDVRPRDVAGESDLLLYHHSIGAGLVDWVAGFPGTKTVVHHSVTPPAFFEAWSPAMTRAAERGVEELSALARVAPHAVGVSQFDAGEARAAGFASVGVLPIAPARRRLDTQPDAAWMRAFATGTGPIVLTVGRLAPNKRIEVLLAAHALVERAIPGARLVIAGHDGGLEGYGLALRSFARDLGLRAIELRGPVSDAELVACYRSASLFVSASEHEGCGLPVLEAMHHGVPVVARAAAAIPETAGKAALLLDTDDPAAWADAVLTALTETARRTALVEAGRAHVAEWLATDLRSHLRTLIEELGSPSGRAA